MRRTMMVPEARISSVCGEKQHMRTRTPNFNCRKPHHGLTVQTRCRLHYYRAHTGRRNEASRTWLVSGVGPLGTCLRRVETLRTADAQRESRVVVSGSNSENKNHQCKLGWGRTTIPTCGVMMCCDCISMVTWHVFV
jgi:hypothetical protein